MVNLIEFIVFSIIVPVLYLIILGFDFLLIVRASTLLQRWRNLGAVMAGFLLAAVIILLDLGFGLSKSIESITIPTVASAVVVFAITGFLVLLIIDFLLRRGLVPFIIMFTVAGVLVSGYFLIVTSDRLSVATITIGFIVGSLIYFIMFPSKIYNRLQSEEE